MDASAAYLLHRRMFGVTHSLRCLLIGARPPGTDVIAYTDPNIALTGSCRRNVSTLPMFCNFAMAAWQLTAPPSPNGLNSYRPNISKITRYTILAKAQDNYGQ